MDDLLKFFHARKSAYRTAVRRFDEVIYTPYSYDLKSQQQRSTLGTDPTVDPGSNSDRERDLRGLSISETSHLVSVPPEESTRPPETKPKIKRFQTEQTEEADVFLFEYGVGTSVRSNRMNRLM